MRWLWLDGIEELKSGHSAIGHKVFSADESFFRDHFPGFPVVPGVILLEAMAQLSGKLIGYTVRMERGDWPFPILSMAEKVKFRRFVRPEEPVTLTQHSRGRAELAYVTALEALALDLGKLAADLWLFSTGEFGFVKLPVAFTTGSSMMPQKRNPDLIELTRAQCRQGQGPRSTTAAPAARPNRGA